MNRLLALAGLFLAMFSLSSANPVNAGDPAPAAVALSEAGEKIDLAHVYSKNKYTLVYFLPEGRHPGMHRPRLLVARRLQKLSEKGVAIFGVSTDSVKAQADFKAKYNLPFTLLADTEKVVLKAFGVGSIFGFSNRQAYLIHEGKVVYADHKGTTKQQADDILAFLAGKGSATKN